MTHSERCTPRARYLCNRVRLTNRTKKLSAGAAQKIKTPTHLHGWDPPASKRHSHESRSTTSNYFASASTLRSKSDGLFCCCCFAVRARPSNRQSVLDTLRQYETSCRSNRMAKSLLEMLPQQRAKSWAAVYNIANVVIGCPRELSKSGWQREIHVGSLPHNVLIEHSRFH